VDLDEIGSTEAEALALATIAGRGAAGGHRPRQRAGNLIRNPTLCDLIGWSQSGHLGDGGSAAGAASQKAVLERAPPPTFPLRGRVRSPRRWPGSTSMVPANVDGHLRGQPRPAPESVS